MTVAIREAVVVEGKYDAIRLRSVVNTTIVETDGFGIFRQPDKMVLLRELALKQGLIVLTDSDSAGFVIRDRIDSALPRSRVKHAYIPEIMGKERRKEKPSKEGLLGVEGMELAWLEQALAPFADGGAKPRMKLTKADFYALGLSGVPNSENRRKQLANLLNLPDNLSANALLEAICLLISEDEFERAVELISRSENNT